MPTSRIVPANLRDLSYIASHMRDADRAEVEAQIDEWSAAHVAALSLRDYAYVVELDGNPEAAFGCGRVRQGYWVMWSWGGNKFLRCVPAITRFTREILMPAVLNAGALRAEARALATHTQAHRWLERLGATYACTLRNYGKNGEDFYLFEWVRSKDAPLGVTINRPDEVLRALAPGLSPRLKGGNDDAGKATTQRLPSAMLSL